MTKLITSTFLFSVLFSATFMSTSAFATPIDGRVNTRSIRNDPTYKGLPLCATPETMQFLCATRGFQGGEITASTPNRTSSCYRAEYGNGGQVSLLVRDLGLVISRGECLAF